MEINGSGDASGEADGCAGTAIEDTYPAAAEIGKKILADVGGRKLRRQRVIESAADNGAAGRIACPVAVEVDRAAERWIARRPFCCWPAVVRPANAIVDLFPGRLADIIDEHAGCAWLKSESERIAKAKHPDRAIISSRGIVERIVGRDGAIGIDPQHLPEQVGKSLRVSAVGVLPDADVELAIRAEMECAAIVIGGRSKIVEFQDNSLAARCRSVARCRKSADPVVDWRRSNGIIKVEVVIGGEVWIERDPKQAAFAGRIDCKGDEWSAE